MQYTLPMKFRVLRAERGLSLRDAEKLTGVDRATISDLEHDKRRPYDTTLARICKGYGVELADVLEEYEAVGKVDAPAEETGPRQLYFEEEENRLAAVARLVFTADELMELLRRREHELQHTMERLERAHNHIKKLQGKLSRLRSEKRAAHE